MNKPMTDEELAATDGHATAPWHWTGWNYGGEAFWNRDQLEGELLDSKSQEVLCGRTTEGDDSRVEVMDEPTARLIELAPRLLAEVRRLRSDEWLEKALTEAWKAGIDGRYGPEAMVMGMMPFLRKHRDGA